MTSRSFESVVLEQRNVRLSEQWVSDTFHLPQLELTTEHLSLSLSELRAECGISWLHTIDEDDQQGWL